MLRKFLLYLVSPFLLLTACFTDEQATLISNSTFMRIYADEFNNTPLSVTATDNGYLALATATQVNADGMQISRIKLLSINENGAVNWVRIWPESNEEGSFRAACLMVSDNGITVLADSLGVNNRHAATLIDFSAEGGFIGKQVIVEQDQLSLTAKSMTRLENDAILIALNATAIPVDQNNSNIRLYSVSKINENYQINWEQRYGEGSDFVLAGNIFSSPQQEIFFAATNRQNNASNANTFKVKPNESAVVAPSIPTSSFSGNLQANQLYYHQPAEGVEELALVGTVANNGNEDIFFALMHADGSIKNDNGESIARVFINATDIERGIAVTAANGGGYIVLATAFEGATAKILLKKLFNNGKENWSKVIGGDRANEEATAIIKTADGGYLILGSTVFGERAILIVKVNAQGELEYN